MDELKLGKLTYLVKYPEGFSENGKYPVLFFLHGAGTRGTDTEVLRENVFFELTENMNLPFIMVAPLCSENTWLDCFEHLRWLVKEVAKLDYTDEKRIYLTGNSMGGYGTWYLAMSVPEYFAAIVPICGGGIPWNAGRLVNVPVWAFHGAKDDCVPLEESEKMVDAVNRAGGNAKLTIYPDCDHLSWTPTYSNPEVFAWLLKHESNCKAEYEDKYTDSVIYG